MDFEENTGTGIWVTLVKLVLLVVTGIMTWSFLSYVMGPDKQLFAILGLVAFEGGIILWPMIYKRDAVTKTMEGLAVTMIAVSWAGIGLSFIGEIMRYNAEAAALLSQWSPIMPYAVGAIVLLNVLAYTVLQMLSPKAQMERAMRVAQMAAQTALIYQQRAIADETMAQARAQAPDVARVVGAQTAAQIRNQYGDAGKTNGVDTSEDAADFLPPPAPGSPSSTRRAKSTQHSQPPR